MRLYRARDALVLIPRQPDDRLAPQISRPEMDKHRLVPEKAMEADAGLPLICGSALVPALCLKLVWKSKIVPVVPGVEPETVGHFANSGNPIALAVGTRGPPDVRLIAFRHFIQDRRCPINIPALKVPAQTFECWDVVRVIPF
jgi:hypothetical protein